MMLPIGPPQGSYIARLAEFFITRLPHSAQCRVQLPLAMSDHSEPEPDICLVQRSGDDYHAEHPTPKETLLVVEVSHSSLAFDLGRKLRLYAKSNIAEYWVIDAERKVAVVHRVPRMEKFDEVTTIPSDAKIAPLAFPECELDLAWLFR